MESVNLQSEWIKIIDGGDLDELKKFIGGRDLHCNDNFIIKYVLEKKNYHTLKLLMLLGGDSYPTDEETLLWADTDLRKKIVWTLVHVFGNANELSSTSLAIAALGGHKSTVKKLLEEGADPLMALRLVKDADMIEMLKHHNKIPIIPRYEKSHYWLKKEQNKKS